MVCLINAAAYYHNTDIDLDTFEDLDKFLLSNQLGHACSRITKQDPLFVYKEPAELPGYGLGVYINRAVFKRGAGGQSPPPEATTKKYLYYDVHKHY